MIVSRRLSMLQSLMDDYYADPIDLGVSLGRGGLVRGCVWTPGAKLGSVSTPGANEGLPFTPGATLGRLVVE